MKIISVVGARPNFMKVAPIHKVFKKYPIIEHKICHTGQHYDEKMNKVFFDDLELPIPDFYLGVGSGTHAEQTANVMIKFEQTLLKEKPDLVIVFGDVNSTIACSLTAKKLHIKVAHIEAGLRSFDNKMPEEINRILTDRISDYLFVTEQSGINNLKKEGVSEEVTFFSGNVMIDSLIYYEEKINKSEILHKLNLITNDYVLLTLHRPSNVDSKDAIIELITFIKKLAEKSSVVFPIHPRTRNNMIKFEIYNLLLDGNKHKIIITDPLGYIDFQSLVKNSKLVVTDSGGIQEETTYLGVQCITLRTSTERPITIDVGTNQLIGGDLNKALFACLEVLDGKQKQGTIPPFWDGNTADRIVSRIVKLLEE